MIPPHYPPQTEKYRRKLALLFLAASQKKKPLDDPVTVSIEVNIAKTPHLRNSGDIDNYAKIILDGLVNAGVIIDDSRVVELSCVKRQDKNESVRVVVQKVVMK